MTDPNLIRPANPAREGFYRIGQPRARLIHDGHKPETLQTLARLQPYEHPDPEINVVIGGDGTMLRAIRQYWHEGKPFFGLNTGTLGFLLNQPARLNFWEDQLHWYQLPLLDVNVTAPDGTQHQNIAFNDCWVERETGQTSWVEVSVNGEVRMPRMVADGMLVATAAGSTSYARAMGATPLPLNANLLTLAGACVLIPQFWHPAVLPPTSVVRIRNLDPIKRPLRGFIDGIAIGPVLEMTARVKPQAHVELLFTEDHDPVAKLAVLQFPQIG
jgi:NAD kinase